MYSANTLWSGTLFLQQQKLNRRKMKHIHQMINSKAVDIVFNDKTGELAMAMEYESEAADILKMKLAAIYVESYCINYETTNIDFAIKNYENLNDVFADIKSTLIDHASIYTIEEIKNPEQYWFDLNHCFYFNNKSFKQSLAFVFIIPDLKRDANDLCYVKVTFDVIESNYEFFE